MSLVFGFFIGQAESLTPLAGLKAEKQCLAAFEHRHSFGAQPLELFGRFGRMADVQLHKRNFCLLQQPSCLLAVWAAVGGKQGGVFCFLGRRHDHDYGRKQGVNPWVFCFTRRTDDSLGEALIES